MEHAVLLMILGNCITLVMFDSEDRNCINPACKKLKVSSSALIGQVYCKVLYALVSLLSVNLFSECVQLVLPVLPFNLP